MLAQHLSGLEMYDCPHVDIAYQTLCAMQSNDVVLTLLLGPSVAKTTASFGLPGEVPFCIWHTHLLNCHKLLMGSIRSSLPMLEANENSCGIAVLAST